MSKMVNVTLNYEDELAALRNIFGVEDDLTNESYNDSYEENKNNFE